MVRWGDATPNGYGLSSSLFSAFLANFPGVCSLARHGSRRYVSSKSHLAAILHSSEHTLFERYLYSSDRDGGGSGGGDGSRCGGVAAAAAAGVM